MKRTTGLLAVAAFALGGLVSAYALLPGRPDQVRVPAAPHPVWQEVVRRFRWISGVRARPSSARRPTAAPR